MPTRVKQKPQIRDHIEADARVIALEGFQPNAMMRAVDRGSYFRLNDAIVRQFPEFFAVVVPVGEILAGEIER
jgi:hypothetical protein